MDSEKLKTSVYIGTIQLSNHASLIWSGLTGYIGVVSPNIARMIINESFDTIPNKYLVTLIKNGVLVKENINENQLLKEIVLADALQQKRKSAPNMTIFLSYQCNCKCIYCYQKNKNIPAFIDKVTIDKSINYAKLNYKDNRLLKIHLFGGEPLLDIDLLHYIVKAFEKAKNECNWDKILYEITTNGTLWSKNIERIFSKENLYKVQVSFDGLRNNHNLLRPLSRDGKSSFDILWNNLTEISDRTQKLICRLNVCEENKEDIIPLAQRIINLLGSSNLDIYLSHLRFENTKEFNTISGHEYSNILYDFFSWYYSEFLRAHPFLVPKKRYLSCYAAFRIPKWISTNGELFQCQHQAELGVPQTINLDSFLENPQHSIDFQTFDDFLSLDNIMLDKCIGCKYYTFCGGICPAGILSNDIENPSCDTWEMRLSLYGEQVLLK
ncbi:MAG: 4Fe-4S cluster-binding domain-containing protein [Candidatus Krumholzibacteriota bacterium]|nr:4Fe-4S cluster-binding domain-containing protein [Candidatus Krumholzibacteriota bacterium]